jgi:hypothetical protein
VVTWIHKSERDENFENIDETILRFLRDACGPKFRDSSALEVVPSGSAHRGRYLTELHCGPKLPWQERTTKWERWTAAVHESSGDSKSRIPAEILPFALGSGEAVQGSESSIDSPLGWSPELQTDTSAVFGHIVFARQDQSSSPTPTSEPTTALDTSLPRTFVPLLPALGSLKLFNNLKEEGLWHTNVVIRFVPSPDTPSELIKSAPDLELGMEADHREVKRLTHLRAITDSFAGDVLFPKAAVDTRLVQNRYFTLPGASIEHYASPIVTFLNKSDLRPRDGKLNTPPSLPGLRLPRRMLSPLNTDTTAIENTTANATTPDTTTTAPEIDNDTDLVEINYSLASIEIRRTLSARYEGLKLRYTSIQAGQRGGERAEISLEAVRVGKHQQRPTPEDADNYELVDAETENASAWSPTTPHVALGEADKAAEEPLTPAKPVSLTSFLQVASRIVDEKGLLKWHAT